MKIIASLRSQKFLILLCFIVFVLGTVFGLFSYDRIGEEVPNVVERIYRDVRVEGSPARTSRNIMMRNILASLITLVSGITIVMPIAILFTNGFLAGVVIRLSLSNGITIAKLMTGTLPHAVFELPAFIIAATYGIRIGVRVAFPGKELRVKAALSGMKEAAIIFLFVVLPLMMISALLETYVSARLLSITI